jgi:hypothetical protein
MVGPRMKKRRVAAAFKKPAQLLLSAVAARPLAVIGY